MSRFASFSVAIVLAAAYAFADTHTEPPTMVFRVLQGDTHLSVFKRDVMPYRSGDVVIVIAKDTVRCGQKPINTSVALKGSQIALHYDLTPAAPDAPTCPLVSEFLIGNVPDRELTVAFSGGPEAATVAKMQKCPNYNPKTDDVWECLIPKNSALRTFVFPHVAGRSIRLALNGTELSRSGISTCG
jgi:hypothetical protein